MNSQTFLATFNAQYSELLEQCAAGVEVLILEGMQIGSGSAVDVYANACSVLHTAFTTSVDDLLSASATMIGAQ